VAGSTSTLFHARAVLAEQFGYPRFRAAQLKVLGPLLGGRHVLAVLPTGAGKSLCYQVPALLRDGVTVVVSPLVSLMQDQVAALRRRGIAAAFLNSTLAPADRRAILGLAVSGQVRLLYCAPERLASLSRLLRDAAVRVPLLAVDEAHCIVEWGNAFRPVYRQLGEFRYHLREPQTLALTGSATPVARREILQVLRISRAAVVAVSFDRPNLRFEVERVRDDRARFARLIGSIQEARDRGQIIVYTPTRRLTELVARALRFRGLKAAPYHAGLDTDIRRPVLNAFLHDRAPIVVATSAFGMGIDKPDVRLVLHWGPPRTLESYYQEAGRAGRDGAPATCRLLWRPGDLEWGDLTEGMRRYVERRRCRRHMLLEHFGDRAGKCSGCDVCG
jgi:ATP-dependent DNA helicase RecQ